MLLPLALLLSVSIVIGSIGGRLAAPALAGSGGGAHERLVAVESKIDAGLPCGDGAHHDCGYDDSIVTFNSDGSHQKVLDRRVTSDSNERYGATTWSRDGQHIAFLSGLQPATIRPDGTELERLQPTCCFYSIAWTRDSKQLLLAGSPTSASIDGIYELRIKHHRLHRLTHGEDAGPTQSAKGAIAFVRRVSRKFSIYVIAHSGAKPRRLLSGYDPNWSPDGKRIAFSRPDGIYTASSTGRHPRRITTGDSDLQPTWAPGGARIVFRRYPALYLVHSNGTGLHRVNLGESQNLYWTSPSWRPRK
jgi:Tol biopolymer transport system component